MTDNAYLAPRLTLRVGVTGHRPKDLAEADHDALGKAAQDILERLATETRRLGAQAEPGLYADEPACMRLASAIAEGADRLVTEAAASRGYEINLILPFRRRQYADDFDGDALADYWRWFEHPAVTSCTELDLGEPGDQREAGYEAAGHLVLAHSDVLLAVWDGKPSRGRGGTAEIIDEARLRGLITLWLDLQGQLHLWVPREHVVEPLEDGDWKALTPGDISQLLNDRLEQLLLLGRGPDDASCPLKGLGDFARQTPRPRTRHCVHEWLRALLVRDIPFATSVDLGLERERSGAWKETLRAAHHLGGDSYEATLDQRLRQRWIAADNRAIDYAHRFRSAYTTNFLLAALAVLVGLLAVLAWDSKGVKALLVSMELAIIASILFITWLGRRGQWQSRWLAYRSLAEAIRPARLSLLIGTSPVGAAEPPVDNGRFDWIPWYVRCSLREIGPPDAVVSGDSLRRALDVALHEEIDGQIGYHQKTAERLETQDDRLEYLAKGALWLTLASGVLYLVCYLVYLNGPALPAELYKPVATLLGGFLPVLGAAIFGIRATGDLRAAAQQSRRMSQRLKRLGSKLTSRLNTPERPVVRRLLGQLQLTMADDLKVWSMIYSERELVPGF
ncbi:hypothetical protein [Halomonas sp. RT37]|uniref:DUF4231 domain-containing protein n=1 Tax=Halomonas sp. RT37 TaxID=2950872 RepID=A0AAU7KCK0_9GAMM